MLFTEVRIKLSIYPSEPSAYVLRVHVDNFSPLEVSSGDQCCWTNGYSSVTASP